MPAQIKQIKAKDKTAVIHVRVASPPVQAVDNIPAQSVKRRGYNSGGGPE